MNRFSLIAASIGAALAILFVAATGNARAQSLDGFVVGTEAASQLAARPKPQREGAVGDDRAGAWDLGHGLTLSVTWSPASGKVVFVEKDWDKGSPTAASGVPGLIFGLEHLSDIRERFGSNVFGFRSNVAQVTPDGLAFANCFEIADHGDLVLVVVSVIHKDQLAAFKQHPDSGQATLETVILADRNYLRSLWGAEMQPDPKYHPIEWR